MGVVVVQLQHTWFGKILVQRSATLYMQFWFDCITRLVGVILGFRVLQGYNIIGKVSKLHNFLEELKLFMLSCFRDLSDKLTTFPFFSLWNKKCSLLIESLSTTSSIHPSKPFFVFCSCHDWQECNSTHHQRTMQDGWYVNRKKTFFFFFKCIHVPIFNHGG